MGDEKSTISSKRSKPNSVLNFVMVTILIACMACQMAVCVYNYHQFTTLNERMGNLENTVDDIPKTVLALMRRSWIKARPCAKEGPFKNQPQICKVWLSEW